MTPRRDDEAPSRLTPAGTGLSLDQRLLEAEQAVHDLDRRIRLGWNATKDKRVQNACEDVKLVAEFVARYLNLEDTRDVINAVLRQDKDFVEAFEVIHGTAEKFDGCLRAIDLPGPKDQLVDTLSGLADELRQWLGEAVDVFVIVVKERTAQDEGLAGERSRALRVAGEMRSQLRARELIREAENALGETLRARDETKKVAGDAGASKFALDYDSYAKSEFDTANRLRWAVVALLLATALGVVGLNVWLEELSLGAELLRLSVTIPIAVLAGYLVRESSKHRATAIWARELAIAMRTITTYIEPLDAAGIELRRVLGLRAFGAGADRSAPSGEAGLYDDLAQAVTKAEGILHRVLETLERRTKS
jgi:hypothetical protein